MNAQAKREMIEKLYGNVSFRGAKLSEMQERQIHAIYGRLMDSGYFQEWEDLKFKYAIKHPDFKNARNRAENMSIFDLRKAVNEVNKKDKEGYQYTLFDWQQELEGKEQEKEWQRE